jgi:hypothetical protein
MNEHFQGNQVIFLNNCPFDQKNIDPLRLYDQLFWYALESHRHTWYEKEYYYGWRQKF